VPYIFRKPLPAVHPRISGFFKKNHENIIPHSLLKSKASFRKQAVEDLVNGTFPGKTNNVYGQNRAVFRLNGFNKIYWRSAAVPVNGTIDIVTRPGKGRNPNRFSIPVSSGFMVGYLYKRKGL